MSSLMELQQHMLATYRQLRRALYLAAFALPLVLIAVGGGEVKPSISAYYDATDVRRDIFVGTVCAVGFGILAYKGFKRRENIALNISGVMAFGVALIPHESEAGRLAFKLTAHGICAVTFFLGIIYVCIFHAKDTIELTGKEWFGRAYKIVGCLIVVLPLAIWALSLPNWKFWAESAAIWAFGAYWWLKTDELEEMPAARQINEQSARK